MQRRDSEYILQGMLNMEMPDRRKTAEEIHGCIEGGHTEGWV